jgi:hypothetical protein
MKSPKVYITQVPTTFHHPSSQHIPKINTAPCLEFGEIVEIFPPNADLLSAAEFEEMSELALLNFDPSTDYMLPLGSPILTMVCGITLSQLFPSEKIKTLVWHSKLNKYREGTLIA